VVTSLVEWKRSDFAFDPRVFGLGRVEVTDGRPDVQVIWRV